MAKKKEEVQSGGLRDIGGMAALALGVLLLLSLISYSPNDMALFSSPPNDPLQNFVGLLGSWMGFVGILGFGAAGYVLPFIFILAGVMVVMKYSGRVTIKFGLLFCCVITFSCLLELMPDLLSGWVESHNGYSAGGVIGHILGAQLLMGLLGEIGAAIVLASIMLVLVIVLFEVHPLQALSQMGGGMAAFSAWMGSKIEASRAAREAMRDEDVELEKSRERLRKAVETAPPEPAPAPTPKPKPAPVVQEAPAPPPPPPPPPPAPKPKRAAKKEAAKAQEELLVVAPPPDAEGWVLPPLSILDPVPDGHTKTGFVDVASASALLTETLKTFGVEAEVTNVEKGPVVTSYEVLPAPGVRVEKISGLSKNLALALKAESIRVQAPVPGKGVVGIEIPNPTSQAVFMRQTLESDAWDPDDLALPVVLGMDVSGNEIVADLADMPHLLIAGATGSGKSVCMNSLLAGLLLSRSPDELRLMLVDPKIVEFSVYNDLPHLVVPVITDPKKVSLGLRWAINEMEKRYKLFAKVGVRNIKAYNTREIAEQPDLFDGTLPAKEEEDAPPKKLPYIVIIIDELADLMMVAQADVENSIARIAQLARAVGIHMVIATQRPSVNVITGTIKANFPARIAFQVAQRVDSRTILDGQGAENLLGKGDLLFLPPGTGKLVRAQGTLTTDQEINRIVDFHKAQGKPEYISVIKDKIESKRPDLPEDEEEDELVEQAIEVIRQTRRASTSSLQRRLRIGYNRAARLMDQLEEKGVVGPPQGSDPREILIDLDGEIPENPVAEEAPAPAPVEPEA